MFNVQHCIIKFRQKRKIQFFADLEALLSSRILAWRYEATKKAMP
jgi:hypothetical protein